MILSLVAMTELKKCCITNAYLQWLFHSSEQAVARGPQVADFCHFFFSFLLVTQYKLKLRLVSPLSR